MAMKLKLLAWHELNCRGVVMCPTSNSYCAPVRKRRGTSCIMGAIVSGLSPSSRWASSATVDGKRYPARPHLPWLPSSISGHPLPPFGPR